METSFTTEKIERKLNYTRNISVFLIVVGILLLFLEDYSGSFNLEMIGSLVDSSFFFIFGIILFVINSKKIKSVSGSYVLFRQSDNFYEFDFKSRQFEKKGVTAEKIESIDIKLKTVEIFIKGETLHVIYLEDYLKFVDKKAIKEKFSILKNILQN